jgi:putative tryptophan/tyrosine transport system substrate-binding protein
MRRREFIAGLGGAAAWPFAARAQTERRRIGYLSVNSDSDLTVLARLNVFRDELQKLGWTEGRNVRLDYRFAANNLDRLRSYATELVEMMPDVIFSAGTTALTVLRPTTRTIPIVFAQVSDPVELGFVPSVSRPGGNITGFALFETHIAVKWLEVLKEIAPSLRRVLFIYDPTNPASRGYLSAMEASASPLGVQVSGAIVRNVDEIAPTIEAFAREPNGALVVMQVAVNSIHRDLIIALAARHKLPAVYMYRLYVADGGLASYGVDISDGYRRAASYVDRILKGERVGDLPVQFPTKYELVINLKTAKALGLTIPETLLATADEVIQ